MGSLTESWEIREGLVSWTLRHMFSLSCPPPSLLSLNYKCPPTLGSGEPWMEGGMRGFHLLFINTGSGNTPHCQPNPFSLHLVPWQRGAAMTRYRAPDVPRMRGVDDRVFTPLQLWMYADEDRVGWGEFNGIYWRDPCYHSHIVVFLSSAFPLLYYISFPSLPLLLLLPTLCFDSTFFLHLLFWPTSTQLISFLALAPLSAQSVFFSLSNHDSFPRTSFIWFLHLSSYISVSASPFFPSLHFFISITLLLAFFHNSSPPSSHTSIILRSAQDVGHQSRPATEDQQSNNSSGTYCIGSNTTFSCLTSLMYSLSQGGHSCWLIVAAQTLNLTERES